MRVGSCLTDSIKATFSRAFAEFSEGNLLQNVHEAMVKKHCDGKLAGHISRDSIAIEVREKPVKKKADNSIRQPKRKRGCPSKGEVVPLIKSPIRP